MPTPRAVLTGVRGIHRYILPTGPCCLVRKQGSELTPRYVMNALGETVVVRHPVDRQVFDGDQIKSVHDATAVLVGEVAASPGDTLMHAGNDTAPPGAFRCAFLLVAETTLHLRQRVLLSAKETRVGDVLPIAQSSEGLKANVNAHLPPRLWEWR